MLKISYTMVSIVLLTIMFNSFSMYNTIKRYITPGNVGGALTATWVFNCHYGSSACNPHLSKELFPHEVDWHLLTSLASFSVIPFCSFIKKQVDNGDTLSKALLSFIQALTSGYGLAQAANAVRCFYLLQQLLSYENDENYYEY